MGDQPLTILMGIQSREELKNHLESSKNVVIMKVGTQLEKVKSVLEETDQLDKACLLYTSPSPRDVEESRMPSSA